MYEKGFTTPNHHLMLTQIKSEEANVSENPIQRHKPKEKNVSEVSKETAVLAVLGKRLVEERLPRALALKEKVDRGEVLDDFDVAFLDQVLADSRNIPQGVRDDPRYKDAAGRILPLYKEIMDKALENERAKKPS